MVKPLHIKCRVFRKNSIVSTTKKLGKTTNENEPQNINTPGYTNDITTSQSNNPTSAASFASKKPTNNYDWLSPPKTQYINTSTSNATQNKSQVTPELVIDNKTQSTNNKAVNKKLSSLSSSSSNSSSPPNRYKKSVCIFIRIIDNYNHLL